MQGGRFGTVGGKPLALNFGARGKAGQEIESWTPRNVKPASMITSVDDLVPLAEAPTLEQWKSFDYPISACIENEGTWKVSPVLGEEKEEVTGAGLLDYT